MSLVELQNVNVTMDGRSILEDISVKFEDRQFVVIFGPNGAGKTTLLKLLIGEIAPVSGTVKILGKSVQDSKREIGYVPQRIFAKREFPISVLKVVLMGRYGQLGLFRRPSATDYDAARQALERVGLENLAERNIAELSGGERQRVFLARALAAKPRMLLLDEATSGVDVGAKETLYDLLSGLKSEMAVIFVTHDMSVVSKNVDNIVCLNKKLVAHGKPEVALTDEALRCMYGGDVSLFSHCHAPHIHVEEHS